MNSEREALVTFADIFRPLECIQLSGHRVAGYYLLNKSSSVGER